MSCFYDRQGNPMTLETWVRACENPRVAETMLPDGTWISTVWLGMDHGFGEGPH